MPTRNTRKQYAPNTYYHVYSRGVNKQPIFQDGSDYVVFLSYLKRYLSPSSQKKANGQTAQSYADTIDLLCYCLMTNHVHLLFYQLDDRYAMPHLLQRVFTSYSMYFNRKYNRVGPLFQSRYLASPIDDDAYLHHISRYIHRNPSRWRSYEYSSLRYFLHEMHADWIKPELILGLFDNDPETYLKFVETMNEDDEETISDELAHT